MARTNQPSQQIQHSIILLTTGDSILLTTVENAKALNVSPNAVAKTVKRYHNPGSRECLIKCGQSVLPER